MTYTEYFETVCPMFMTYGMSYEQFWYGEPGIAKCYYEYNRLMNKKRNEELWVNGLYTLDALQVALNNAFDKHKIKYVSKPLDIYPKTAIEKKAEKIEKTNKLIRWLNSLKPGNKHKQEE